MMAQIAAEVLTAILPEFICCSCGCSRWHPERHPVNLRPVGPLLCPAPAQAGHLILPSCAHSWTAYRLQA